MDIDVNVKELTTYDIGEDGKSVVLRLTDVAGSNVSLRFQIPDLGNLAMTLPSLIEAALRRQYRDGTFRFAYPTGTWSVEEANDPSRLILTLRTNDGFAVSFAMTRGHARQLGSSLVDAFVMPAPMLAH